MIADTAPDDPIATLTALVTGIGLLAAAIGVAFVKIARCLEDVHKQVYRSRAEVRSAGTEQVKSLTDISRQLAGVRMLITTHVDLTDHKFDELTTRMQALERERDNHESTV